MTVRLLTFCIFTLAFANPNDPAQIEKYGEKVKTYRLEVPGKEPITIIETSPAETGFKKWEKIPVEKKIETDDRDAEMKNLMTHIIHDVNENNPRCYGPSCQAGFTDDDGPHKDSDDYLLDTEKLKDFRDFSKDRLDAITQLAAKLKKEKIKVDRYSSMNDDQSEEDGNGKVYTSWNRLKVKHHKHPYDDKDGWVTLEPVAWSTSKISKWKPNVKKQKPNHWNDDQNIYPSDDVYTPSYQGMTNNYNYVQKKPTLSRPGFINNKLHLPSDYDSEMPSKPTWTKPVQSSYTSTWSPDDGRRPHKPNCDSHENYPGDTDDTVFYGISDSVVTDNRPAHFPYDYEALHQSPIQRPMRRPTQVVYAGSPELDNDRHEVRPLYGDGQWVLLSTTKGYRNKKRQRSLTPTAEDRVDFTPPPSMTSHQTVALTVLPVDNAHTNMTTSHGGLLEVEKSFQTVEESKRDMDKKFDLGMSGSQNRPLFKRIVKRKIVSNVSPDSSSVLAAVGAGMVPATMAMVVPMMLGRRRRRDVNSASDDVHFENVLYRYR